MTTDTTQAILRDLVAAFTFHPEAIEIDSQVAAGSVYWMLRGHPDDEPVLIGKQGGHVRALTFLIQEIGKARGETHTFRLMTEHKPRARPPMEQRSAMRFDPEPARELLVRVLQELAIGDFLVEVGPGVGERRALMFEFTITVRDQRDANVLLAHHVDEDNANSLVETLGTLFRAIAKKNGVRFEVKVATT